MKFLKYEKKGAYHWREYEAQTLYGKHANKVKKWIRKGRTLDIGAGDGLITFLIGAEGIDDNAIAIKLAKEKGVNVKNGTAYNLGYPENSFDNVLMADVIEHLKFPERAIKEIKKVLKPNGKLYITTPLLKPSGVIGKYHYKEYTKKELGKFISELGFSLDKAIEIKWSIMYAVFNLKLQNQNEVTNEQ